MKSLIRPNKEIIFKNYNGSNISSYFPVENRVDNDEDLNNYEDSFKRVNVKKGYDSTNISKITLSWRDFLKNSEIPKGYKYAGFHYGGFIWDFQEWCLPSWIWTSAALVRLYCHTDIEKAIVLGELFLREQQECGGWIVRFDYDSSATIPELAPNDSAYIANNAMLNLYKKTNDQKYLDAAKKCADWIIETSRPDGMVYLGYNIDTKKWNKKNNIVDTGFTAALFAELFNLTKEDKYHSFLEKFVDKYIDLFYNRDKNRFWTAIVNDRPIGGSFARGQAWALEGLIPAYKILQTEYLRNVIDSTISTLISKQLENGAWAYNLDRPLLGIDCKGISVIALSLFKWMELTGQESLNNTIHKAIEWCKANTCLNGKGRGGIYSFSMEGAIVHNLYTETAMVYSTAYAIELSKLLNISE